MAAPFSLWCWWSALRATRSLANVERFAARVVGDDNPGCGGRSPVDSAELVPPNVVSFNGDVAVACDRPNGGDTVSLCRRSLVIVGLIALDDDAGHRAAAVVKFYTAMSNELAGVFNDVVFNYH